MKARLLGAAALVLFVTSASADIVSVTITGTIAPYTWNGHSYTTNPLIDTNGIFGTAGASLFGASFIESWTVNTGTAIDHISGNDALSPILSTFLTINGRTVSFGFGGYGVMNEFNTRDSFHINISNGLLAMDSFVSNSDNYFPGNISTPWTYNFNPLTDNLDSFHQIGGSFSYGGMHGYLAPQTFAITSQAVAVPAPLVGSGLPGLLLGLLAWFKLRQRPAAYHQPSE